MLNYVLRENIKKVYKLKFYVESKKKLFENCDII